MDNLFNYLIEKYGYDEPIFTKDLQKELNLKPGSLRQAIKRLADKGLISKAENGIYFIPNKNTILKKPVLSVDKIVKNKYINSKQNGVIGYKTGTNFANSIGLTTQTASIPTIVTNNTSSAKREVKFYNKKVVIKKPKTSINNKNFKVLQVLDLLNDFDRLSEEPLTDAKYKLHNYLEDVQISEREFNTILNSYKDKAKVNVYESGVYDEITQKQKSF